MTDVVRIVVVGNFGLRHKQTMAVRALPIAQLLSARGHQVAMVLPPWDSPKDGGTREDRDGVVVHHVPVPRWPATSGDVDEGSPALVDHLVLTLRVVVTVWRLRPDVVYAFKPKAYAGLTLLAFWLLRKLRLFHGRIALDTDDWEGAGGWADLEAHRYSNWQRRFIAWHEGWCLRHADVVTVASRELERRSIAAGARQVLYLPNQVSPRSPSWRSGDGSVVRARHALADRQVVLLYTRFFEYDVARSVVTFERIHEACPDTVLLVVGAGLHGDERRFARLVAERGLSNAVVMAGWVDSNDLADYFAAADVALYLLDDTLVNRTKCPVKLLDLLTAGVPVVADRVGQAVEYIDDGLTGVLVPPGDVDAMAAAAVALLASEERRRAIGGQARERMRREFRWEDRAPEIAESLLRATRLFA